MSLSTILNIGVSGLMTAQNQLSIVSDNISNPNTPGYIRKKLEQEAVTVNGVGACVTTGPVRCLRVVVRTGGQIRMCDPALPNTDSQSC